MMLRRCREVCGLARTRDAERSAALGTGPSVRGTGPVPGGSLVRTLPGLVLISARAVHCAKGNIGAGRTVFCYRCREENPCWSPFRWAS